MKDQMRQSLMEVNETKARLFPDKENAEGPCLREQVEKISQRIERITEERHEREVTKLRDRKLRLEMEKMRVRRIMKTNYSKQLDGDDQLKQGLLRKLSEQIDEELENVDAHGRSYVTEAGLAASFSRPQGVFRSPTHQDSLLMSAADGGSRHRLQHSQASDRRSVPS